MPFPGAAYSYSEMELYQGPMLPAAELERLEQLRPGITGEWLEMVKDGTTAEIARRNRESEAAERASDGEVKRADTGQSIALFLALICLGASIVFFALGNAVAGGLLLSFPVLQLVQSFIPRK